jgi:hypothetical protein
MLSLQNDRDLAILLAGGQGARLAPARAGTDALASLRSGNESLVLEYLLQKQAEERRNALLARLQSAPLPAESVFSLLHSGLRSSCARPWGLSRTKLPREATAAAPKSDRKPCSNFSCSAAAAR